MKLNKLWDGLKQITNGDYVLEGDLISEETIEVDLDDRLVVRGKIVSKKSIIVQKGLIAGWGIKAGEGIEAGWGIKAGEGIEAGEGIKAGEGIEAGEGIKAGEGIEAGWGIKAGEGIEAGCGIKAGWGIEAGCGIKAGSFIHSEKRIFAGISVYRTNADCIKTIRCAELRKGEICFGNLIITKPEPKTFKVVCVDYNQDHEKYFTIGKVYTWNDNTMKNDDGFTYHGHMVLGTDPDKWELSAWYKFIKIIDEKEGK